MSLTSRYPLFRGIWDDPWDGLTQPSKMFDQHFGSLMPGDFRSMPPKPGPMPAMPPMPAPMPAMPPSLFFSHSRPMPINEQQSGVSEVTNNNKEFKIIMDVQHFKPDEISIKTRDNRLVIHARHEERPDEHGFIMREFTRQYILPKDVDPATVVSCLTRDGMLTLKGPKIEPDAPPKEYIIPITRETRGCEKDCKGDEGDKDCKGDKGDKDCKGDEGDKDCKGDKGDKDCKGDKGDKDCNGDKDHEREKNQEGENDCKREQ